MVSYGMVTFGAAMLWLCFIIAAASAVFLAVGHFAKSTDSRTWGFRLVYGSCATALLACLTIVVGFFTHNIAIQYVAQNYPVDTGSLFWLYKLSGLWAGRAGSLLLWGFLISAFAAFIAWKRRSERDSLTTVALMVIQVVLVLFTATMLFSSSNSPFLATDSSYISDGKLTGTAMLWGMNILLEHWAMVLHPPMLFIGYAGMTVPFAYGLAALIVNDPSRRWIDLCQRIALFAFIFLTIGIGLGAVWAYVVLGWGGYWGWDPVENASLLSWLTSVAMLHSFNVYRRRSMMHGWALLSATLTFVFVVLGTFITRSGLVQSVHAFSNDNVSTAIFLIIMIAAFAAFAILWFVRRKDFANLDDIESVASKNGSYYLTCLIMVFAGILLAYLTVCSALPSWMPAGGTSIGTGAYETISRPLGILVCLLAAVCPFLSWKRTDGAEFWRNLRAPLVVAAAIFVALLVEFFVNLLPAYNEVLASGGTAADDLASMGPSWYYNGLAVVGLFVASMLACNSLYLLVRGVRGRMKSKGEGFGTALGHLVTKSPAAFGGYLTHLGLGIVLVGLIGSSMYVTEYTYDVTTASSGTLEIGDYSIEYGGLSTSTDDLGFSNISANLSVSSGGSYVTTLDPTISIANSGSSMGSVRSTAKVYSTPAGDLFAALSAQQNSTTGQIVALYLSVRENPLISFVWVGFAVMVVGIVMAAAMRRGSEQGAVAAGAKGGVAPVVAGGTGKRASQPLPKSKAGASGAGSAARPKKSSRPRKSH